MTNKIVLRTIEQFMNDYKPGYTSIMPLFMSNAQQHPIEVGTSDFKRIETIGDIRSRRFGPKDTELHQINAKEGKKTFKKYFFGSQFIQSNLQSTEGYEGVVAQVMDEHNKQGDEIFLTGDGTSDATVENNGLFYSQDPNYTKNSSATIAATGNNLPGFYDKIAEIVEDANDLDGQKTVLVYGAEARRKMVSLFTQTERALSTVLDEAFSDIDFNLLPKSITPAGENGFIVVNLPQVKLHYTSLPKIDGQGVNEEKKYSWTNFIMGSSMLDVLAKDAVIHQPVTFSS